MSRRNPGPVDEQGQLLGPLTQLITVCGDRWVDRQPTTEGFALITMPVVGYRPPVGTVIAIFVGTQSLLKWVGDDLGGHRNWELPGHLTLCAANRHAVAHSCGHFGNQLLR